MLLVIANKLYPSWSHSRSVGDSNGLVSIVECLLTSRSSGRPGIYYPHRQPADVNQVAGSNCCVTAARDAGNQDIADVAIVACLQRNLLQFACLESRSMIKGQNAIDQKNFEDLAPTGNKSLLTLSSGKPGNAEFNLIARNCSGMDHRPFDAVDPTPNDWIASRVHQFRYDIGIEDYHGATGQSLKSTHRWIESLREERTASRLSARAVQSSCESPISPSRLDSAAPNGSFDRTNGAGNSAFDSTASASASTVRPVRSARCRSRSTRSSGTSPMTSWLIAAPRKIGAAH